MIESKFVKLVVAEISIAIEEEGMTEIEEEIIVEIDIEEIDQETEEDLDPLTEETEEILEDIVDPDPLIETEEIEDLTEDLCKKIDHHPEAMEDRNFYKF